MKRVPIIKRIASDVYTPKHEREKTHRKVHPQINILEEEGRALYANPHAVHKGTALGHVLAYCLSQEEALDLADELLTQLEAHRIVQALRSMR